MIYLEPKDLGSGAQCKHHIMIVGLVLCLLYHMFLRSQEKNNRCRNISNKPKIFLKLIDNKSYRILTPALNANQSECVNSQSIKRKNSNFIKKEIKTLSLSILSVAVYPLNCTMQLNLLC